ncbi:MAG: GAF domain-containing protein [Anaerolineales bacterium]
MPPVIEIPREIREEFFRIKQENQTLQDELFRLRQTMRSLVKLQNRIEQITPESDPHELIHLILSTALEAVNSNNGSLMLLDEKTNDLVFVHVIGNAQASLLNYRLSAGQGIAHWVVASRTPKLVFDARAEPLFSPHVDQLTGFLTISLICVPLYHNERTLGALEVVNTISGDPFKQEDVDILQLVARLATLAILKAEGNQ